MLTIVCFLAVVFESNRDQNISSSSPPWQSLQRTLKSVLKRRQWHSAMEYMCAYLFPHDVFIQINSLVTRLSRGSLILYIRFVSVLTWSYSVKSTCTHSLFSELCFDDNFFYFFPKCDKMSVFWDSISFHSVSSITQWHFRKTAFIFKLSHWSYLEVYGIWKVFLTVTVNFSC